MTLKQLTQFIAGQPNQPILEPMADDPRLRPLVELAAKHDPQLRELMDLLIERHTSFSIFDYELYPQMFLRGKKGERWNESGAVVGDDDVCIGRNGGGDIYVWSAATGKVRFHIHDEDWVERAEYDDVDDFITELMQEVVEAADVDQIAEADDAYLARFRFALHIAGDEDLDDDVREALEGR